jgi:hypothetical protein
MMDVFPKGMYIEDAMEVREEAFSILPVIVFKQSSFGSGCKEGTAFGM